MRTPISGAQFRRDVKLAQKRGWDWAKLREVIALLIDGKPLPGRYKDHPLGGDWRHHRDCHIEPDWLLIYSVDGDDLYLVRTGTHSDFSDQYFAIGPQPTHRAITSKLLPRRLRPGIRRIPLSSALARR